MQELSGIERRDVAITNNTPGEAWWTRGFPTEDHQIRSGNWNPSVKANEKKKKKKSQSWPAFISFMNLSPKFEQE